MPDGFFSMRLEVPYFFQTGVIELLGSAALGGIILWRSRRSALFTGLKLAAVQLFVACPLRFRPQTPAFPMCQNAQVKPVSVRTDASSGILSSRLHASLSPLRWPSVFTPSMPSIRAYFLRSGTSAGHGRLSPGSFLHGTWSRLHNMEKSRGH